MKKYLYNKFFRYEKCWLAIQKDVHGILFVYDPQNPSHEAEIDYWVSSFPKEMNIPPIQCMAFANHQNGALQKTKPRIYFEY
jgi:intraflagellar transport protein 22